MLKRVLLCSLVTVALSGGIADASHQVVTDGNDAKGALDIKRVESWGAERPARKIITFGSWTTRSIRDNGYFLVWYDTRYTSRFDYFVLARSVGRKMEATLWRDFENKRDRVIGDAEVWRRSDSSVVIRIRLSQMKFPEGRQIYRWQVESIKNGGAHCSTVCFDRAPDSGFVVEPVPQPAES